MDHREATLLLVDYVRGDLDEPSRRAVAAHVAAHPDCAQTVQFLARLDADLARHRERLLDHHPAAETLVALAVGADEELDPAARTAAASHVGDCAACFADLQTVRRVHAELVEEPAGAGAAQGRRLPRWPVLGAALAAGLLLGLAVPRMADRSGDAPSWQGPVSVVRVDGVRRGDTPAAAAVPAGARALPFVVVWDPWTLPDAGAQTPLVIRIGDAADGRELWRLATTIGAAWDGPNRALSFVAPAAQVGLGDKLLTIEGPSGVPAFSARLSLTPR